MTKRQQLIEIGKDWTLNSEEASDLAEAALTAYSNAEEDLDVGDYIDIVHKVLRTAGYGHTTIAELEGIAFDIYDVFNPIIK